MSEWISVEDALPEQDGEYLAYEKYQFLSDKGYMCIRSFSHNLENIDEYDFYGEEREGWYNFDNEYGYFETDGVTHWMPLPQPPKGESNDR